jgi:hypothetical protein
MIGPGKYDDLCTQARDAAKAQGAILLILGGEHGSGFSAQLPAQTTLRIPEFLRDVADGIERAVKDDAERMGES